MKTVVMRVLLLRKLRPYFGKRRISYKLCFLMRLTPVMFKNCRLNSNY